MKNLPSIGYGDHSILSAIVRASEASDTDRSSPILSGVCIDMIDGRVRCSGTDGKFLASIYGWGNGIAIPRRVVVESESIRRAVDLYRRCRLHFSRELGRRDPSVGTKPLVIASMPNDKRIDIEVPGLDDGCALRLASGSFPVFSTVEEKAAYAPGFGAGSCFDAKYVAAASRILGLGQRAAIPYHLPDKPKKFTIFPGNDGDYCLIMSIAIPDSTNYIFGKPT